MTFDKTHDAPLPPTPDPLQQESNRRTLWWAVPMVLLSLALLYPVWHELGLSVLGGPDVVLREAYGQGDSSIRFDHSRFDALLREIVDDQGFVDYGALFEDSSELDTYLTSLASADFEALGRDEKLALLLNAYNACTLALMTDHWPVASVREIPPEQRWEARRFQLFGRDFSLRELEDEWLRARFAEPRIHFALSTASLGGPPLRMEAYVGDRLDEQLTDQTRRTLAHPRWANPVGDTGTLQLTQLFLWYGEDFAQTSGSVLDFVRANQPRVEELTAAGQRIRVVWIDHDWRHNGRSNRPQ